MQQNNKNGTVELLRVAFCLSVLLFHISMDIYGTNWRPETWGGVLRYGALGVEFFLITSGYFMANTVHRQLTRQFDLIGDTWLFIWNKIRNILPYHVCFNMIMLLGAMLKKQSVEVLLNKASCLLFLPAVGFNNRQWMLGAEWYIGYMLITMFIIYPFLRRFYRQMTLYIAPLLSILLYGYLAEHYGTVMDSDRTIEAFAGILLGISVYSISQKIKNWTVSNKAISAIVKICPVVVILGFVLYMNSSLPTTMQPFLVLLLGLALAITFAGKGMLSASGLANNRFVYWLGTMTLPIYMIQNITRVVTNKVIHGNAIIMYIAEITVTVVGGLAAYYIISFAESLIAKRAVKKEASLEDVGKITSPQPPSW